MTQPQMDIAEMISRVTTLLDNLPRQGDGVDKRREDLERFLRELKAQSWEFRQGKH